MKVGDLIIVEAWCDPPIEDVVVGETAHCWMPLGKTKIEARIVVIMSAGLPLTLTQPLIPVTSRVVGSTTNCPAAVHAGRFRKTRKSYTDARV